MRRESSGVAGAASSRSEPSGSETEIIPGLFDMVRPGYVGDYPAEATSFRSMPAAGVTLAMSVTVATRVTLSGSSPA